MGFTKFTSIESFAHVYRGQEYYDNRAKVMYGAKIKLHGTNAAVRVTSDGEVFAQSRSRDITPAEDNAGFAAWVAENKDAWALRRAEGYEETTYFGEWAGKGIQKGDAVCQLSDKYFFVFGILIGDEFVTTPADIEDAIPDLDQVVVLPWSFLVETEIDFNNAEGCSDFAKMLQQEVDKVAERDPFIYDMFGISAPGEGYVLSPVCNPGEDPLDGKLDWYWYTALTFKAKTEAHAVQKAKVSRDIIVPDGVFEFVEMFVTPARCEQGLTEIGGKAIPQKTGEFMKWIGQDIKKESQIELSDAGLEWKDVSKHVGNTARAWWLAKCEEIV